MAKASRVAEDLVVHIFYRRKSFDIPFDKLSISAESSDTAVKEAVAQHLAHQLDIALPTLAHHVVEKEPTGNITVRPEATLA